MKVGSRVRWSKAALRGLLPHCNLSELAQTSLGTVIKVGHSADPGETMLIRWDDSPDEPIECFPDALTEIPSPGTGFDKRIVRARPLLEMLSSSNVLKSDIQDALDDVLMFLAELANSETTYTSQYGVLITEDGTTYELEGM